MKTADVRKSFLKFFEQQGHALVPSDSLIPSTDPSLLFTSAGMVQFKPNFQNPSASPFRRAASCQKCLRTSDIERVGHTLRHLTFFEMLGNFSFGDYFKKESIAWGWEFLTQVMKLPKERLIISVFKEDDEAADIWKKVAPNNLLVRLGEDSNFWTMGPTGPCGPCSEILWDRGAQWGKEGDFDCDRYLEIWNHVFTQFDRQADGQLVPLPRKNIDTGMGLERLSLVVQGVDSPFDTNDFLILLEALGSIAGGPIPGTLKPGQEPSPRAVAFRRIADHSRAVTFMINDGILPLNEGRGYVLRRLLRQAVRAGKSLGVEEPFLYRLTGTVVETMKEVYADLIQRRETIASVVKMEEEKFLETLDTGTRLLEGLVKEAKSKRMSTLPGKELFQLYDTYGFPFELTREMTEGFGLQVDAEGFRKAQEQAVELARQAWKGSGDQDVQRYRDWKAKSGITSPFLGYDAMDLRTMMAFPLFKRTANGWVETDRLNADEEGEIVLERTPFYPEGGGQVGDAGRVESPEGCAHVLDTQQPVEGFIVHKVKVVKGYLEGRMKVQARVDVPKREATMRHHTATHMLHKALREVLGVHVAQAGSLVAPDRLRFDFNHNAPLSREERQRIEDIVNEKILSDLHVRPCPMAKAEAQKKGAMMLFGEKYGDEVRAVSISEHDDCDHWQDAWSMELCGGTHVPTTGRIGLFKILSQSSVSAGVRRVEAVAGLPAIEAVRRMEHQLTTVTETLKTTPDELLPRIDKLLAQERQLEKELLALKSTALRSQFDEMAQTAKSVGGIAFVSRRVEGVDEKQLREVADRLKDGGRLGLVVLATVQEGKVSFVVSVQKEVAAKGIHAGQLAKDFAALIQGSGGGRPDFAQGGGKNPESLDHALNEVESIVKKLSIKTPHKT